jgi:hypothetical protein
MPRVRTDADGSDGSPDDPTDPAWRRYERQIRDYLLAKCGPSAEIAYDKAVHGELSGVPRQADIWVAGIFAGFVEDGTAIVDCKYFSRKVDVKHVEAFIAMVEDVNADFGVMFTTQGYTQAAMNRVRRGIRLRVVPTLQLAEFDEDLEAIYEVLDRVTSEGTYSARFFDHEPYGDAGCSVAYESERTSRNLYVGKHLDWSDDSGKADVGRIVLGDYLDRPPGADLIDAFVETVAKDWVDHGEWEITVPELDRLARSYGLRRG